LTLAVNARSRALRGPGAMSGLNLSFDPKPTSVVATIATANEAPAFCRGPPYYSAMVPRYFGQLRVGTGAASIRLWLTTEALE
jgi:hypothetical protein